MITILSGKLTIPEDERFIGFVGDDQSQEVELLLEHFFLQHCTCSLSLRFDDGTVRIIPLEGEQYGSDILLTWKVRREHLHRSGVVTAQLRIQCDDGRDIRSTRNYFLVGGNMDGDSGDDDYVTTALLEEKMSEVNAKLPYVNANGAFIVNSGGDVRIAKAEEVYTKTEIDDMIGDVETQLSLV